MITFTNSAEALDFMEKVLRLAREQRVVQLKIEGLGAFQLIPDRPMPSARQPGPPTETPHPLEVEILSTKTPEDIERELNDKWGVDAPAVSFRDGGS